jgi:hypothetical protein
MIIIWLSVCMYKLMQATEAGGMLGWERCCVCLTVHEFEKFSIKTTCPEILFDALCVSSLTSRGGCSLNSIPPYHGLPNYIDTKAKCCHLKKLTCKGTFFAASVSLSEAPSPPDLIQHPLTNCIRVNCIFIHTEKGDGGELSQRES